jgi:hypothetical protein
MMARTLKYHMLGLAYRSPCLSLITDGCATDYTTRVGVRLHKLIEQDQLRFQAFGMPGPQSSTTTCG